MAGEINEQGAVQNPIAPAVPEVPKPSRLENFLNRIRGIENVSSSTISEHQIAPPTQPNRQQPLSEPK